MDSIVFNEGYKEISLNNDPNRIIRFNPSDMNLITRFNEARKAIEEGIQNIETDIPLKNDGTPDVEEAALEDANRIICAFNDLVKAQINYIFADDGVADVVFLKQSPVSIIKGRPLVEIFLEAAYDFISKEMEKETKKSNKRISEYQKAYKK